MKKTISNILCLLCIALIIWVLASIINVNMHNLSDGKTAWWNFFNYFMELGYKIYPELR